MAIAHDAAAPSERKRWYQPTDNPLVRAVGRVPMPLGGKLLVGFAVVAALLAVVAVLGLVTLSQSNARGEKLRSLQQTAAYAQLLAGDAGELNVLVGRRREQNYGLTLAAGGAAAQAIDSDVLVSWLQFNRDAERPVLA